MFYITHSHLHTHTHITPPPPRSHTHIQHTHVTWCIFQSLQYYMLNIIWPEGKACFLCQWETCVFCMVFVCAFSSHKVRNLHGIMEMPAHLVLAVMVCGRMQNKWSISPSACSWIQIFTNGLSEGNLSNWTVIIILDLNAWALLSRYLFKHTK